MFRLIAVIIILALLVTGVSAQNSGYDLVVQPPEGGLLPVGTTLTLTVYDAANGMQPRQRTAVIEAYVRWNAALGRPVDYYVVYPDSCRVIVGCDWMILNRETAGG